MSEMRTPRQKPRRDGRDAKGRFSSQEAANLARKHKSGHPWRQWQGDPVLKKPGRSA
jgi:hypothetical protein